MRIAGSSSRFMFCLLFFFSGFAGLIYESIWSHYLKLFLGHAAYAQTLVLCIFMGGLSFGAWLVGKWSEAIRRPLLIYAVIEGVLGIAALSFDPFFRGLQAWFFSSVLPNVDSVVLADLAKWSLSAATILPQSILLGATFPLMSAGVLRLSTAGQGSSLSWLYFSNSFGAAIGVLVSGMVLIDKLGLPGTLLTAGLINFFIALVVYLIVRGPDVWNLALPTAIPRANTIGSSSGLLLWIAALTGAASFFYEIAWIRMLSLVIGSATHSFELMLSAFITGLAIGSFLIRRKADANIDLRRTLAVVQIVMGAAAVLTIPIYLYCFEAMAFWMRALDRGDEGYVLFTLFAHALCFVIMLPATICAGMTLPLITTALLRAGGGEREIGRVYASNTLGSIAGIVVAVHLVMPLLGLRAVVLVGGAIDIALGIVLLVTGAVLISSPQRVLIFAASGVMLLVTVFAPFDPAVTSSGVFRFAMPRNQGEVLFHRDGKTATVDVARNREGSIYIATNGKTDAAISPDKASSDDYTMILLALAPLSHYPAARDVAVIGMGSGRTTHVLLHSPAINSVDTIEIEPAMVEGARTFGKLTEKTFLDPRSHIQREDAKAYFARSQRQYDLIVSEPSNPWVSGVSSLFSGEFYRDVKRYIKPGGLFTQWFHLYEIDLPLVATVFNALSENFDDYVVYSTNAADIVIIASPIGAVPPLTDAAFTDASFAPLWERLDFKTLDELRVRRLGGRATLARWMRSVDHRTNSDYFPVLDQNAVRRRFKRDNAIEMAQVQPYSARIELGSAKPTGSLSHTAEDSAQLAADAMDLAAYAAWRQGRQPKPEQTISANVMELFARLRQIESECNSEMLETVWVPTLRALVANYAVYLPKDEARQIEEWIRGARCFSSIKTADVLWLDLFSGVAAEDWGGTQKAASALLNAHPKGFAGESFVMAELLLADLKIGGPPAADNRMKGLVTPTPEWTPLQYLRANIDSMSR